MTARQPQHCDHECVCAVLAVDGTEGDTSPCDFSGCLHDTRHNTSPPAPESLCEGCTAEDEMCGKVPSECYSRYQENIEKAKAHDAQVAKSERERVWGKLIAHHAGCWYKKGKDEHQSWVDSIESLRGAQEEQGGSER